MRDIASDSKIIALHSKVDKLLDVFKKTESEIGSQSINELTPQQGFDFAYMIRNYVLDYGADPVVIGPKLLSFDPEYEVLETDGNGHVFVIDSFSKIMRKKTFKGRLKTSKFLYRFLESLNLDPTEPRFQKILAKWQAMFNSIPVKYKIGWKIKDFDSLGESIVDENSCYRKEGEWKEAPVILATGIFGNLATFVIKIYRKEDEGIVGRCWGFISPQYPDKIFLSNGYYDGIPSEISIFVRVVEHATGEAKRFASARVSLPLYINSDCSIVAALGSEDLNPRDFAVSVYTPEKCLCGGYTDGDKSFCSSCLDKYDMECNACGEGMYEDDAYYCEEEGESFCGSCFESSHRSCGYCGTTICDSDPEDYHSRDHRTYHFFCDTCKDRFLTECEVCGDLFFETQKQGYYSTRVVDPSNSLCEVCEAEQEEEAEEESA